MHGDEQYRELVEQVRDYAIFRIDPEGRAVTWNEGVRRVLGYDESEFLGLNAVHLFTPEDRLAGVPERELDTAAKSGSASNDRWMLRKDGRRIWVMGRTSPIRDAAGRLVGFSKVMRDQTDLKQANEALRTSEARLRHLSESGILAIAYFDGSSCITDSNDQFLRLLGFTRDELRQGELRWDRLTPAEWLPLTREAVIQARRTGRIEPYETEYFRKDGTRFWALVGGSMLDAERGIAFVLDITPQKRVEQQLRQAQRLESVGRLAGGVAHELNNMLTVIVGYAAHLERSLPAGDARHDEAGQIIGAADRSASLLRQLLAFARRSIVRPVALDLNEGIRENARLFRPVLGEVVEVELDLSPDIGLVQVDRAQFDQLVLNLALNARDAMPDGGRLTIRTRTVQVDEDYRRAHAGHEVPDPGVYTEVVVSDTGVGMDPLTLQHAFEPFYTTQAFGQGTGLGLAMVYGAVKQSGGFIRVSSEPGRGTTFEILLPAASAEPAPAPVPREAAPATDGETILLVEDEEVVREVMARTLREAGYRVLDAPTGPAALDLVRHDGGPIALLVTDVVMPGIGGREVARQVRQLRPDVAVLYMSAYDPDEVVQRGMLAPHHSFLPKPVPPRVLLAKVREILDRKPRGSRQV